MDAHLHSQACAVIQADLMLGILHALQQATDTTGSLFLQSRHLVADGDEPLPLHQALHPLNPRLIGSHLGLEISQQFLRIARRRPL